MDLPDIDASSAAPSAISALADVLSLPTTLRNCSTLMACCPQTSIVRRATARLCASSPGPASTGSERQRPCGVHGPVECAVQFAIGPISYHFDSPVRDGPCSGINQAFRRLMSGQGWAKRSRTRFSPGWRSHNADGASSSGLHAAHVWWRSWLHCLQLGSELEPSGHAIRCVPESTLSGQICPVTAESSQQVEGEAAC